MTRCFADCSSLHCRRLTPLPPPPTPTQVAAVDALSTLLSVRSALSRFNWNEYVKVFETYDMDNVLSTHCSAPGCFEEVRLDEAGN